MMDRGEGVADPANPRRPDRWWKGLGVIILIFGGASFLKGEGEPTRKVVEAERFVLRDRAGKVRAEFGLRDDEPGLTLLDSSGRPRTRLVLSENGSGNLSIYDREGKPRAILRMRPSEEPELTVLPKNGTPAQAEPSAASAAKYRLLCQSCHGGDGQATQYRGKKSPIPNFTDARWQASRTDARLTVAIRDGLGEEMPPFEDRLSAAEVRELVARVRAFGPATIRPVAGETDDFDRRFRQLQQDWESLQKQVRELSTSRP